MFSNKMQKKGREKVHFVKWYCRTWFIYNFLTGYKNRLQLPALPLKKKKSDRSGRIMLFVVVVDVSQCTKYLQATLIS
jgi:hypothetical protein